MLEFYNEFKKHMGMFDASIEYLEFCTRYISSSDDKLDEKISSTGIKLNQDEIKKIKKMPYQMYILSTYGVFEEFIANYRSCLVNKLNIQIKDYDNMSKLDIILKNLGEIDDFKQDIDDIYKSIEYSCLEYYRYCRNRGAHQGTDFEKKIKSAFDEMQKNKKWKDLSEKYPINYIELNFNDFTLMSKCILDLVNRLMKLVQKKNLDLLKQIDLKSLNRFQNNPDRYKTAIIQKIITELNLDRSDAEKLYSAFCLQKP